MFKAIKSIFVILFITIFLGAFLIALVTVLNGDLDLKSLLIKKEKAIIPQQKQAIIEQNTKDQEVIHKTNIKEPTKAKIEETVEEKPLSQKPLQEPQKTSITQEIPKVNLIPPQLPVQKSQTIRCVIDAKEFLSALNKAKEQNELEQTLTVIITKIDAPCKKCTKQEKKTIIQLKMIAALKAGKQHTAQKYLKELDKYVD